MHVGRAASAHNSLKLNSQKDEDLRDWSLATSARLRLLQASCADLSPEQRRMHLSIELEHLIGGISADKRGRYVRALLARFPAAEGAPPATEPCAASVAAGLGSPFVGQAETPEDLLEKLIALSRGLNQSRRAQMQARLAETGLANSSSDLSNHFSSDPKREADLALSLDVLKAKLDLPPDRPIDLLRLVRLLSVVLDVLEKLDSMVWNIWKRIAPSSRLRPSQYAGKTNFREKVAAFVDGQTNDNPEQLASSIDHGARMSVALLNGLGMGGRNFAKKHLARLAPENVALEARREGGGFMQTLEHRSWQHYEFLWRDLTAESLENELREEIARAAEALHQAS